MRCRAPLVTAIMIGACHASGSQPGPQPQAASSRFLFVWAGDADRRESDFLAVIDVDPRSANYASVVATLPVGATGTRPYHTEYQMPATGVLWANGFDAGQTFRFDLRDPRVRSSWGPRATPGPSVIRTATRGSPTETSWPRFNGAPAATTAKPEASGPEHAALSLDISDPSRPREVSRLTLRPDEIPHWIALEPKGDRLVITGYRELESRVLLAQLNRTTDALRLDITFKTPGAERPGVDFGRERWPHGPTGRAIPHGAVFSRP